MVLLLVYEAFSYLVVLVYEAYRNMVLLYERYAITMRP